jgi:hemoglobin-like flavoprotein
MANEPITESLEQVAERCDDPAPLVYARLFAQQPEMRDLFVRDADGSVRGQMLYQAIEAVLDFVGPRAYSANHIRAEVVNHENLGVPPRVFASFFTVMMETFQEVLGDDWTAEYDRAWRGLVAELQATTGLVRAES